jgi:hypothetical protein
MHDALAALLDEAAARTPDGDRAVDLAARAAVEHERARDARLRASAARARLAAEGAAETT